jgi:hypothetical protein
MPAGDRGVSGRILQIDSSVSLFSTDQTAHVHSTPSAFQRVTIDNPDEPMVLLDRSAADYDLHRLIVDVLQRVKATVYFEVGGDNVVKRVLMPRYGRVVKLTRADQREWRVNFEGSAVRLKARTENREQRRRAGLLEESFDRGSRIEVTFDPDSNQIIDVRRSAESAPGPAPASVVIGIKAVEQLLPTTPGKAADVFAQLAQRSCDPEQPAAGCIPFQFVGDGCWMRAHQMCGFLGAQGIAAGKIWIYGDLHIQTRFTKTCDQDWNFHVAAFTRTTDGRVLVHDPSICRNAVSVDDWLLTMNDPHAEIEFSAAPIYVMAERGNGRLEMSGEFARERASFVLELLKLRATGPLPFDHCPV